MERGLKCMYCAEMGITNTDVFIEIVDVELGAGWICKECFIESEKEKEEHLKELEQELKAKEQECEKLKKNYFTVIQQRNKAEKILTEIKEIAEKQCVCGVDCIDMKQILQKISECEVE